MTAFERGDVVLVEFVFSDELGSKLRPALVISAGDYQQARQEVIVAAITSNVTRQLFGDQVSAEWQSAGVLFPSMVTGIIRTIKQDMIHRTLGTLTEDDLEAVDRGLRESLSL